MANVSAVYSVGYSLISYLRNSYPEYLRAHHACLFQLFSSGELNAFSEEDTCLSLYLYRITMNEHVRNQALLGDPSDSLPPLALDLHYLLTVWSKSAEAEHTILAWAIRQLYLHQTLSLSDLSPSGGWSAGDVVQVIPAELTTEDMMRIWDALSPPYSLSASYIARVVRVEPDTPQEAPKPVVERRMVHGDRGEP